MVVGSDYYLNRAGLTSSTRTSGNRLLNPAITPNGSRWRHIHGLCILESTLHPLDARIDYGIRADNPGGIGTHHDSEIIDTGGISKDHIFPGGIHLPPLGIAYGVAIAGIGRQTRR